MKPTISEIYQLPRAQLPNGDYCVYPMFCCVLFYHQVRLGALVLNSFMDESLDSPKRVGISVNTPLPPISRINFDCDPTQSNKRPSLLPSK